MKAPAIVHDPREQWLEERRSLLTASDVAAVLGVDPRRGALAVYADKVGAKPQDETLPMRRGRVYQNAIAEDYAGETGREVEPWPEFEILRHPSVPFLGATLDARTRPEPRADFMPLELKLAIGSARDWKEGAPLWYQVQAQAQAACAQSRAVALAALVGPGPLSTHDLDREDAFFEAALPVLEAFWGRVQRRDPPPADSLPGTSSAIRRLFSKDDGSTVTLDAEALELVEAWERAKAERKAAEERKDDAENELRMRLGEATYAELPDGSFLSLKTTERGEYRVAATSFRVLRHQRPRIPKRRR